MGDDTIFDFVVSGLRDDLLGYEIRLGTIRTPVDDLLRKCRPYTGQRIKFVCTCAVDVD